MIRLTFLQRLSSSLTSAKPVLRQVLPPYPSDTPTIIGLVPQSGVMLPWWLVRESSAAWAAVQIRPAETSSPILFIKSLITFLRANMTILGLSDKRGFDAAGFDAAGFNAAGFDAA